MPSAKSLIQAFATINSTEELILFVAGKDGMLAYCQELIDLYDSNSLSPRISEIRDMCSRMGVLPGALFSEVRKVLLALNKFHDSDQDHYALLGLQGNATVDEVKKAYRALSKEYHPDSNKHADDGGKRFMEISGAYHSLMVGFGKRKNGGDATPWRKTSGAPPRRNKRRERNYFIVLVIGLVVTLSGFSIFLSTWYTRQAAIKQFPSRKTAGTQAVVAEKAASEQTGPARENIARDAGGAEKGVAAAPAAKPVEALVATAQEPVNHGETTIEPLQIANRQESLPKPESAQVAAAVPAAEKETAVERKPAEKPAIASMPAPKPEETAQVTAAVPAAEKETAIERKPAEKPAIASVPAPKPEETAQVAAAVPAVEKETVKAEQNAGADTSGTVLASIQNSPEREARELERIAAVVTQDTQPGSQTGTRQGEPSPNAIPPNPEAAEKQNSKEAIFCLIQEYENHYNKREFMEFMRLFAKDAMENGRPLAQHADQYQDLFTHTKAIKLQMDDIQWNSGQNGYKVKCAFNANYSYDDGRDMAYNGNISFHMVEDQGTLKIKSLEYVFQE